MASSRCNWGCSPGIAERSEEHTSELQSHSDLVCRLLLEKKKKSLLVPILEGHGFEWLDLTVEGVITEFGPICRDRNLRHFIQSIRLAAHLSRVAHHLSQY